MTRLRALMTAQLLVIGALVISACQPEHNPRAADDAILVTVLSPDGAGAAPEAGLFQRYGLSGPAEGFTRARLSALESRTIMAAYPPGAAPRAWTGPRLSQVLAAAGAPGAGARVTALDGYAAGIRAARIAAHEPILALSAGGEALSLGGLGPVMVIWPPDAPGPQSEAGAADWVWGVFAIEALNLEG